MRIWHEELIPKLCRQHLLACWREGLGCYNILTENKSGYRNHPQVIEFEKASDKLWVRLSKVRGEMVKRGYNPKELPELWGSGYTSIQELTWYKENQWQTLEEQTEVLKNKGCNCLV